MSSQVDAAKCVNTIRVLAADMVEKANSGHPGAPMGCAPIAHVLWTRIMNYNAKNPHWFNRDRFVLSNGHACALLYSMLHLTGYDMPLEQLKNFRQLGSITAGHPENTAHPAIEVTTGPLGQGIANGVGLAIAEKHLAAEFNKTGKKIVDNMIYVLCGDGCLQEGISGEASSLAGHLGLGNLVLIYDDNKITIDGKTNLSFSEDVVKRYESYGWHTMEVKDGNNDLDGIENALREAKSVTDKPTLIKVSTTIGFGSSKADTAGVHGSPLKDEALREMKEKFGWNPDKMFEIPDDVLSFYREAGARGEQKERDWNQLVSEFKSSDSQLAAEFERRINGQLPAGWEDLLPKYSSSDKADATRNLSGKVLNALADKIPELVGGSADLTPSNKTLIDNSGDFQKTTPEGRYIRYGVREHAMTAIGNGMCAYGGIIPYVATFLNFIGYSAGATRLSALSELGLIFVATHDSIGLGEDGPTHQPVEMIAMLRALPHMRLFRPADGNEVSASYLVAIRDRKNPSVLSLTRQNVPHLEHSDCQKAIRGAYQIFDTSGLGNTDSKIDLILAATGSEVSIAIDAAKEVNKQSNKRVAVVSMPCWELFEEQGLEYKRQVIPAGIPVLSIEAASSMGWDRYAHAHVAVDTFGVSAPYQAVYEKFGITPKAVAEKAGKLVQYFEDAGSVATLPVQLPDF